MLNEKEIKGNDVVNITIPGVDSWSIKDLKYCCKNNKVKGYSKMSKEQLIIEVKKIIENSKK